MSSSFPFHGIFSSLGQEEPKPQAPQRRTRARAQEEEQTAESSTLQRVPAGLAQGGAARQGQVAIDIFEQDEYYIIKAPIAGVRLSDLDIEISDNVVTIRGRRQQGDGAIPADQYYLQECFWGEFSRSITLPCTIDPKKVRATFNKECILKILVPKEDKVKIVRISEG